MSTQKQKFELFQRLQALGFTYEESQQLRRIEMTLHRWAEAECNGDIQRDEKTQKPHRPYGLGFGDPIADREAGALNRLKTIVDARNARHSSDDVLPYHQGDPRGCALYLVKRSQLPRETHHDHKLAGASLNQYYNRGLAVSA